MRAGGDERPRGTDLFVLVAMLVAAASGRLLDALGLLPGVHEAALVRGSAAGWVTALTAASAVAVGAARRWSRTSSLTSTAAVVLPGQLAVFFSAEAVLRVANARPPVDPDGLLGALLQAGLAVGLLVALTAVAVVALAVRPLIAAHRLPVSRRATPRPQDPAGHRGASRVDARGPPHLACS